MKILKNLFGAFIALFAFLALSATVFAAAPTVTSQTYLDSDANGMVDKITITYNQIIATCTATSADFTYSNSTIGGTLGAVSCTSADANVNIAVTGANTGVTGAATAPTLAYADNPAREISNSAAEQVATYGATEIVDGAQPVVLSIGTKDVFTVNGKIDALKVTFTESIDDSLIENYACGTSYVPTNLAVADATGEAIVCGGIVSGDAADDQYLYISFTEAAGACSFDSQVGCTGSMTTTDVTWTGGAGAIKIGDFAATVNYAPNLTSGMITEADTAGSVLLGAKTYDSDTDGKVDHLRLMFSENIDDSVIDGYSGVTCPGDVSYTATSLAVTNVTGEKVQCPTVAPLDLTDNNELQIVFNETSSTCTYADQTGCDTDAINQDITWTASSILIKDLAGNLVADLASGGITEADGAGPVAMAGVTQDSDGDGKVDSLKLTFSENIDDSLMSNYSAVANYTPATLAVAIVSGEAVDFDADAVDNDVLYVGFTEDATGACDSTAQTGCDTDEVDQDITWTGASATIADAAANNAANVSSATVLEYDSSSPVLVKVVAGTSSGANTIAFTYSEAVTVTNGASSATCGDLTTAGTFAGLGTFGTAGNLTVATTKNTVAGSGTDTVTVTLANQSGGYLITSTSATITVPSGTITGAAAAGVVDANSNQVKTSAPAVTATTLPSAAWDVTRPTISAAALHDSYTNDGNLVAGGTFTSGSDNRPDTITLTASETLKTITDASATRDDWGITAPAFGTLTVVKAAASGTTYTANFSGASETYNDAGQFDLLNTQDSVPSFVDQAGNPLASGLTSETYKLCYTGYSCTGGTIANSAIITTTLSARPSTGGGTIFFSSNRSSSRTTTTTETETEETSRDTTTEETTTEETSRDATTETEPATETTRETPTYAREESYDRYTPSEATSTEPTREATTETAAETATTQTLSERVEAVREILGVAEETTITEVVSRAIEAITADTADADGDGITNLEEATRGTNANSADSDGDGDPDNRDPSPSDPTVISERLTELKETIDIDSNENGMSDRAEYLFGAETTSRELVFGSSNGAINLGLSQMAFVTSEGGVFTGVANPNTTTRIDVTLNDGSTRSIYAETDDNGLYTAIFDSTTLGNLKDGDLLLATSEEGKEVLFKVTNETIKRPEIKFEGIGIISAEDDPAKHWSAGLGTRTQNIISKTKFWDSFSKGRKEALEAAKKETYKLSGYTEPNSAVMFVFKSATFSSVVISDKDGYFEMEVPKELKDELSQNTSVGSMLHEFIGFSVDYRTNRISSVVKGLFRIYNQTI